MDTQLDRQKKEEAFIKLLEFSLLFTPEDKKTLIMKLSTLSDEDLMAMGRVLALEHQNRDALDERMVKEMYNTVVDKLNSAS